MSNLQPQNHEAWDRFFDWLVPSDEELNDSEIDTTLQRAGIDLQVPLARLGEMIEDHKARISLMHAPEMRLSLLKQLRGVVGPPIGTLREGLRDYIVRCFSGAEQSVQFRKLEKAATPEDLQSLLDDLTALESLKHSKDADATETE